jgi:hypothetical protein
MNYRVVFIGAVVATAVAGLFAGDLNVKQASPDIDPKHLQWMCPDEVTAARRVADLHHLRKMVEDLKEQPLYLRVSALPPLLEVLLVDEVVDAVGFERQLGQHDFDCVAGRAAWFLEEAYGFELPHRVRKESSDSQREFVHAFATRQADAYLRGVQDAVDRYTRDATTAAMQQKYGPLIRAGAINEGHARLSIKSQGPMMRMLDEWYPIGRRLSELEKIAGAPAAPLDRRERGDVDNENRTGVFQYSFTNGMFGTVVFLQVEKGEIKAVNLTPIE